MLDDFVLFHVEFPTCSGDLVLVVNLPDMVQCDLKEHLNLTTS